MIKINRNNILLIINDLTVVAVASFLSILVKYDFKIPSDFIQSISPVLITFYFLVKIFWFYALSLYKGMYRYTSIWDLINIIKANFLSSISLFLFLVLYQKNISFSLIILDFILCSVIISSSRVGIRIYYNYLQRFNRNNADVKDKKNVIIIGAGFGGQNIVKQILSNSNNNFNVIGFLDDDLSKKGRSLHGVNVLGQISLLQKTSLNFDEILICIPSASANQMKKIVNCCKDSGKPYKTLPSLSELIEKNVSVSQLREVSFTDLLGRKEIFLDKTSLVDFLKGKRILVTGAGGSIGSELVRQCVKYNPSLITLVDFSELNLFEIEREVLNYDSNILFKPILTDIRDFKGIENIFEEFKPQIVFHAAAYKHVPMQENFPWEAIKTNVFGTNNLSSLSIKHDVEKFVLVSTDKAVMPTNVMGATKRLAEILIQSSNSKQNKTDFMAVRFGNVLGSSGSVLTIFKEQIKKGGPITITDPDMERYFMSIPEASQLILQAGSLGTGGEIFILDMGKTIKIMDLALELIKLSGFNPKEIPIEITGSRPGEKKIEELSLPNEKLDKTRHDKIFVLNNEHLSADIERIVLKVSDLQKKSLSYNPKEIKSVLSSILIEYNPKSTLNGEDEIYEELNIVKAKA